MALNIKSAFQRFTDEIGNLLSSINRDGTISAQGINFPDGTSQNTAGGGVATGLSNDGNTVTLNNSGINITDKFGNVAVLVNGAIQISDAAGDNIGISAPTGITLTSQSGDFVNISPNTFQVLLTDGGTEILMDPTIVRIANAAFDGFQSTSGDHTASIIVNDISVLDAKAASLTALQPLSLPSYTVVGLPGGHAAGTIAYASNGRKVGEGAGLGTGVVVYFSASSWRVFSTDLAVAA